MTGRSDNTPFCSTRLKYPAASDSVVALLTPSDAVIATSAIGSSLLGSVSRRITAPSIGIACASVMVRNRWARINSNTTITTPAATAMIAQAIFFPVIASIIELFDANVEGDR